MKLRIFAVMICIFVMTFAVASCSEDTKNEESSQITETEGMESESTSDETSELVIADTNKAQGDRDNTETSKEYLEFLEQAADEEIIHVPFD